MTNQPWVADAIEYYNDWTPDEARETLGADGFNDLYPNASGADHHCVYSDILTRSLIEQRAQGITLDPAQRTALGRDTVVAHHEAAHTVIAFDLGYNAVSVTIGQAAVARAVGAYDVADTYTGALGASLSKATPRRPSRTPAWDHARICMAGIAAETVLIGYPASGPGQLDIVRAIDTARSVTSGRKRRRVYVMRAFANARRHVHQRWGAIERLAQQLIDERTVNAVDATLICLWREP